MYMTIYLMQPLNTIEENTCKNKMFLICIRPCNTYMFFKKWVNKDLNAKLRVPKSTSTRNH